MRSTEHFLGGEGISNLWHEIEDYVKESSGGGEAVPGPPGKDGADGKSAYEVAVENGFEGTEAEWLASLVGPAGAPGRDGAPGKDGAEGPPGPQGPAGSDAPIYEAGAGISIAEGAISVETPTVPVTQAEYDSLSEAEREGKLFLVTDAEAQKLFYPGMAVYSEEETVVGTYNGKPVYRKVVAWIKLHCRRSLIL